MSKFFTSNPIAFYDPEIGPVPESSIEISDELWTELLDLQSKGKIISSDDEGNPIAIDYNSTEEELLILNKNKAKFLLSETDWVEIPSVTDSKRTPHLSNLNDFLDYRCELRSIVLNPSVNPTWPEKPENKWI